jgi:phage baseplate assembly protein W
MKTPARNLAQPFQRDGQRDFATASGRGLLLDKVKQVLLTWGPSHLAPGEMPWRTDFGSSLHLLPHTLWDETTAEIARTYVHQALAQWLPEVQLRDVRFRCIDGGVTLEVDIAHGQQGMGTVHVSLGEPYEAR